MAIGEVSGTIVQPKTVVIDPAKGDVELVNHEGKIRINLPVRTIPGIDGVFIQPVPELRDGVLFEPALINDQSAVHVNMTHEFYRRVYLPNAAAGGAIQGLDSLLWSLCVAELNNCTPATATTFREIRYEVSKTLRRLVENLPDPVLETDE